MDPVQPDPSDLMQQLMGLGSVDQRFRMLQEKAARGAQLAQGVPLDFKHGSGASQLASALASLVGAGVGGYDERTARAGQQDLVDKTAATKSMLGALLTGNEQPDLSGLATASDADLPGKTDAARTALGGQRKSALMAMLSGDEQIAPAGKALFGEADAGYKRLAGLPEERVKLAGEQQKVAAAGPQEALGGATHANFVAQTEREKVPKFAVNPLSGQLYDTHSGKTVAGGAGAADLDPAALDQLAEMFHTTGALPPVGRGASAAQTIKKIVNRAAELHPDANLAGNKAGFGADAASLKKLQTSADSIDAFESTALKNLDQLDKAAQGVMDSGLPILNKPLRSLDNRVLGDPKMAAFNAARQTAVQEVGKVLGGAVAGGAISDSQRHEVEGLISGDMTLPQMRAAIAQLKTDMVNRKTSVQEQLGTIRARASGQPAAQPAAQKKKRWDPVQGKIVEE